MRLIVKKEFWLRMFISFREHGEAPVALAALVNERRGAPGSPGCPRTGLEVYGVTRYRKATGPDSRAFGGLRRMSEEIYYRLSHGGASMILLFAA